MCELTELAKQCGAEVRIYEDDVYAVRFGDISLPAFVERIRAEERERIANQWDGCMYDAVGETIDVGASIRASDAKHDGVALPATGRPPELLQDCDRKLSMALSNTPGARLHASEAAAAIGDTALLARHVSSQAPPTSEERDALSDEQRTDLYAASCVFRCSPYADSPGAQRIAALLESLSQRASSIVTQPEGD